MRSTSSPSHGRTSGLPLARARRLVRRHAYSVAAFSVLLVGAALTTLAQAQGQPPAARPANPTAIAGAGPAPSQASMRLSSTQVQQAFQHIDANRDGNLSRREMGIYPRIERHFERIDSNRDGAVSPVEFEDALQQAS